MIGKKLAHYEITTHLGSGGMGDVYQATDSKLDRSVAIKFLPEAFSHDSERVARFQREARVLASLNHSNIAAVHGLEEINGRHFLVMELVPGETLADRIRGGPIPIQEVLPIAKQIVEALQEAHDKGVVHRDLKPANIKVTPEGKVKVLDFGLAKAYEREQADASMSNSPTISIAATNAGVILGTAAYMSPEQASGRPVDKRTDVWAFGVVLLEMLTGRAVFEGEAVSHVLAAVLREEPDWSRLPANTPAAIRRLLRRCLNKDRKERPSDLSSIRLDLQDAMNNSGESDAAALGVPSFRPRRKWLVLIPVAAVLSVSLAIVMWTLRPVPQPIETRVDIVTPDTDDPLSFALSPDGRQIVFVASSNGPSRLWLRSFSGTSARPLPGTEGGRSPLWAPDGRSIAFMSAGRLMRLDLGSAKPQILSGGSANSGASWNRDGVIIYAQDAGSLVRISSSGGPSVPVTKVESGVRHTSPYFLPDGRHFIFYNSGAEQRGIYLGALDSPEVKRLVESDTTGIFIPPQWVAWSRAGMLVAQKLDVDKGELIGSPVTIADSVAVQGGGQQVAVSADASGLTYRSGLANAFQLAWFDRRGQLLNVLAGFDDTNWRTLSISNDASRVAVQRVVSRQYRCLDSGRGAHRARNIRCNAATESCVVS
jgi:eukaryotic-like serine/threonine-protein kinase